MKVFIFEKEGEVKTITKYTNVGAVEKEKSKYIIKLLNSEEYEHKEKNITRIAIYN